jgi:hypothetical protein
MACRVCSLLLSLGLTLLSLPAAAREYHELFASARARSMGMALTATADDWNSLGSNPAGLAIVKQSQRRMPEVLHGAVSNGFFDIIKEAKSLNPDDSIGEQLSSLNGQAGSLNVDLLSFYYVRPRLGLGVHPLSLKGSIRIRTPSLLFASAHAYAAADTGVTLGYGYPLSDRLRWGVAVRPLLCRVGFEAEVDNASIQDLVENLADYAGSGCGVDGDFGLQGNLDPIPMRRYTLHLMWGATLQNILATKFPVKVLKNFDGRPPALDRRINVGVAARMQTASVLTPTLSFELRDMLVGADDLGEYVSVGLEFLFKPKEFFETALRGHFYKGNLGMGVGMRLSVFDVEAGTYAVNMGPGMGLGVDRRYYLQGAVTF